MSVFQIEHVNEHCSIMQVEIIEHPSRHMGHLHAQHTSVSYEIKTYSLSEESWEQQKVELHKTMQKLWSIGLFIIFLGRITNFIYEILDLNEKKIIRWGSDGPGRSPIILRCQSLWL